MTEAYKKIWSTPDNDPGRALYPTYPALEEAETSNNHRTEPRALIAKDFLPKGGTGAEIGVFTGLFSPHLFKAAQPQKMYLVDPWHSLFGENYPNWKSYTAFGRLETKAAMHAVLARTKEFGERIEIVVGKSTDWLPTLPDEHLDWVYLDSSHAYEDTFIELILLSKKLKKDGIIMCDDCRPDPKQKHHAVYRAVRDFLISAGRDFNWVYLSQNQGIIRRYDAAAEALMPDGPNYGDAEQN